MSIVLQEIVQDKISLSINNEVQFHDDFSGYAEGPDLDSMDL
jgi:hypothetical protein